MPGAALSLLPYQLMEFICSHCNKICEGNTFRVSSEEDGIRLLDMIVCFSCALEARHLGLSTQKVEFAPKEQMSGSEAAFH